MTFTAHGTVPNEAGGARGRVNAYRDLKCNNRAIKDVDCCINGLPFWWVLPQERQLSLLTPPAHVPRESSDALLWSDLLISTRRVYTGAGQFVICEHLLGREHRI